MPTSPDHPAAERGSPARVVDLADHRVGDVRPHDGDLDPAAAVRLLRDLNLPGDRAWRRRTSASGTSRPSSARGVVIDLARVRARRSGVTVG